MNNDYYIGDGNIRIVKIMIRNKFEDILLLTRSSSHPTYAGYPDFPGGQVQPNESDYDALERKINEETGLMIATEKAVKVTETVLPLFKKQTVTHALYALKIDQDNPRVVLAMQHDHYDWVHPNKLYGFDPPLEACIDDARDFFLPQGGDAPWSMGSPSQL